MACFAFSMIEVISAYLSRAFDIQVFNCSDEQEDPVFHILHNCPVSSTTTVIPSLVIDSSISFGSTNRCCLWNSYVSFIK